MLGTLAFRIMTIVIMRNTSVKFVWSVQIFDEWANKILIICGSSKKKLDVIVHLVRLVDIRWL